MDKLFIIKIGGNIIDDETKLSSFINDFSQIGDKKILIHGGGKLASKLARQLGIEQKMVDGRRITDTETLKIVTMVYAGLINKNIVAALQANNCNALGLTGADGNAIKAHKRTSLSSAENIDFGFAGDVDEVNTDLIKNLLYSNVIPVFAPITHNQKGQLLNTNADTIAQEIAKGLSRLFDVRLIYIFEKNGVLLDINDELSVIDKITPLSYQQLKKENKIFAGMIPKIDNAFTALQYGVRKVIIGNAQNLSDIVLEKSGTILINE
jgi:acetylglutamate kinase